MPLQTGEVMNPTTPAQEINKISHYHQDAGRDSIGQKAA
jgi:uncharacterized membrane protein